MSKLIIFDTETTGLNEEDRIIQIGAIISELGNPNYFEEPYNELCSTNIPINIESISIHGIRQKDIDDKPSFLETKFRKRFDELNSEENYLIAHNLNFDKKMLEKEGYENKIKCKLIDTYQCAKHIYEIGDEIGNYKLPNYQLQTFRYMMFTEKIEEAEARKYGVEIKAHDAIGDVVILKLFLVELYKETKKIFELDNPKDIMNKMVELTQKPIPVEKVRFPVGEHKGKKIIDIEIENPGLLTWYIEKYSNPIMEVVNAIKELRKRKGNNNNEINF